MQIIYILNSFHSWGKNKFGDDNYKFHKITHMSYVMSYHTDREGRVYFQKSVRVIFGYLRRNGLKVQNSSS